VTANIIPDIQKVMNAMKDLNENLGSPQNPCLDVHPLPKLKFIFIIL